MNLFQGEKCNCPVHTVHFIKKNKTKNYGSAKEEYVYNTMGQT